MNRTDLALSFVMSEEVVGWPLGKIDSIEAGMEHVKAKCAAAGKGTSWWMSNHPADPGKLTAWGVTAKVAANHGIPDVSLLTADQLREVMRDYYIPLADPMVEAKLWSWCVNMGTRRVIECIQLGLSQGGVCPGLVADGKCGPKTIAAINGVEPGLMLRYLCGLQAEAYKCLLEDHPNLEPFRGGWLKRAKRVPVLRAPK